MGSAATSIVFHEHDDEVYVSTESKSLISFKISTLSKG